jgi:hypothetical protein
MKRNYSNSDSESVDFFIGTEVEHTPAFGLTTLFVVGLHPVEEIEKWLSKTTLQNIKHIFFGANQSFDPIYNDHDSWSNWENMIEHFLKKNYLCSLDIPMSCVEEIHDGGLNEYHNFIPQISVKLPYVKLWNYNTMVKIDDKDFEATNPGVWTHSLHKLMDRNCFTEWSKYSNDKVIK